MPDREIAQGQRAGLRVRYDHRRRALVVGGWYDSIVGLEPLTLPLADLVAALAIPAAHWRAALSDRPPSHDDGRTAARAREGR